MQVKALKFTLEQMDEAGFFKGYASTHKKDSYGDIVVEGAFKRTIQHNEGKVPILWFHQPQVPVGLSQVLGEDPHGLYTEGKLDLGIEKGREVRSGMLNGYIDRMSIGYDTIQSHFDREKDARMLTELKLYEYSLITRNFSANDAALVTEAKSLPGLVQEALALDPNKLDPELIREAIKSLQRLLWKAGPSQDTRLIEEPSLMGGDPDETTLRALVDDWKALVRKEF